MWAQLTHMGYASYVGGAYAFVLLALALTWGVARWRFRRWLKHQRRLWGQAR